MIGTGKVVEVESASEYIDKLSRVWIRIEFADRDFCKVRMVNRENLQLDEELVIEVHRKAKAEAA